MESKTIATLVIVILCVLFFPFVIGAIAGAFGLVGGILGSVFGLLGTVLGAIFGAIGSIFGAMFGFIGWLAREPFGGWFNPFDGNFFGVIALLIIVILIARSRRSSYRR